MEKKEFYCMICGNKLDPKIHYKIKELGHFSKEVAKNKIHRRREVCPGARGYTDRNLNPLKPGLKKEIAK